MTPIILQGIVYFKKSTGHSQTKSEHAHDGFEACFEESHEVTEKEYMFTQIFSWYG